MVFKEDKRHGRTAKKVQTLDCAYPHERKAYRPSIKQGGKLEFCTCGEIQRANPLG